MHVMDTVVHANADHNRGDGDGHDIQRYAQQAHGAQHHARRQHVRRQGDQGERQRAEQREEHQQDRQKHHAYGQDLGPEQALQHIVIQHQHTGELDAFRCDTQLFNQSLTQVVQELVPAQILTGFLDPHGDPRLLALAGKIGLNHHGADVRRQAFLHNGQLHTADIITQQVLDHGEHRRQGQHLAGFR